jgi:hypothetical protein
MNVTTDEFKHFFIVHQRLLSITAWHYENVKVLGLRDAQSGESRSPSMSRTGANSLPTI